MNLNLWSILLIASASQCVFLGIMFFFRPQANKKALFLLALLLLVIFAINISNLWYASYLYKEIWGVAGFARGMTLLLGPILYLYTLSITRKEFQLKAIHLLHIIPYLAVLMLLLMPGSDDESTRAEIIARIDDFMADKMEVGTLSISRFSLYFLHLLTYVFLARHQMSISLKASENRYRVPLEERVKWLRKITVALLIIAVNLIIVLGVMIATGYYSFKGNIILTLMLSALAYMVAYQAILNTNTLLPDFKEKYTGSPQNKEQESQLLAQLIALFEQEKIFTDPDLKVGTLAKRLNTSPHNISRLINDHLNKSFFELLNHYRVEEFKVKVRNPEYANYSIMGVANEVGYSSKSSFNTAFKKHTGQTPSQFMQENEGI